MRHGDEPVRRHDLSSLRILGSTGEPWNPEPWRWLFDVVGGGRLPIINYSGGTEISGGLVAGNVLTPLKPAPSPARPRASPPTSWTIRAGRCATRSASWSSARRGSA